MKKNYFLVVFLLLPLVGNLSWSMELAKAEATTSTLYSVEERRPIFSVILLVLSLVIKCLLPISSIKVELASWQINRMLNRGSLT